MDKRERAETFRLRLKRAMQQERLSQSALARAVGVDRATISQLLSAEAPRLPSGQLIAELAATLRVSADWLLGLTHQVEPAAAVLAASLQITDAPRSPVDANLLAWFREAEGYKVRHVPGTLPDLLKTEEVVRFEHEAEAIKTSEQAVGHARDELAYSRRPETDFEICFSLQALDEFAAGGGVWGALAEPARARQLRHMARLLDELYPRLRLYLFDLRERYAAPYTIFGPLRAVLYVGQSYFVFTSSEHVRALTRHFDDLVRAAVVQADAAAAHAGHLAQSLEKGAPTA